MELWNGSRHQGRVITLDRDTLRAQLVGGATPAFRVGDIAKIEVLDGRRRHVRRGASVGALIGGSLGALIGAASYHGEHDIIVGSRSDAALFGGLLGGLPGLVIGAAIGLVPRDQWRPASLERRAARFELRPFPAGGGGLAVALSF
jgi:hypothetical protein